MDTPPRSHEPSDDASYSMRVVTRLTGLSADTIRKWEQRYEAVNPKRTEGNTRKFSAADIDRLSLLRELTSRGHHIMDVARLSQAQLRELLEELDGERSEGEAASEGPRGFERLRQDYLDAVERYDVRRAADLLSRSATLLSPEDFALRVVRPLLLEVGDRWHQGRATIAQEHLVSAQMRGLLTLLLNWTRTQAGAHRVIITTPPGHLHEFGSLVGAVLAAGRGLEPIYLGPNLPFEDIAHAASKARADLILLSVVRDLTTPELDATLQGLRRLAGQHQVWLGGPEGHVLLGAVPEVRGFTNYEDLDKALTDLGARTRS